LTNRSSGKACSFDTSLVSSVGPEHARRVLVQTGELRRSSARHWREHERLGFRARVSVDACLSSRRCASPRYVGSANVPLLVALCHEAEQAGGARRRRAPSAHDLRPITTVSGHI